MCPHLGVKANMQKFHTINIKPSNKNNIKPGQYKLYTCCPQCANAIKNSLNNEPNSPYFGDMEENCVKLLYGPEAPEHKIGNFAQKICLILKNNNNINDSL